jgi:methylenetetrahydrofolate dehydrogenase (NADP+)/methenyltetrahydrofolate cyclohydrolase
LPLPKHIDSNKVLYGINPDKDVDAFHPVNVGRILIGNYAFLPCTPAGCQELIYRAYGDPKGKEVVVVGRSNIVGKPMVAIMIQKRLGANATVTCVHTGTPKDKMIEHCRRADILIVAAGVPNYIQADWVKEGVCVIDVGVNRIGMTESGKAKLAGDVDFAAVSEKASFITPVPGGVGPMTITMLMKNTVMAAKLAAGLVKL